MFLSRTLLCMHIRLGMHMVIIKAECSVICYRHVGHWSMLPPSLMWCPGQEKDTLQTSFSNILPPTSAIGGYAIKGEVFSSSCICLQKPSVILMLSVPSIMVEILFLFYSLAFVFFEFHSCQMLRKTMAKHQLVHTHTHTHTLTLQSQFQTVGLFTQQ